MTTNNNDMTVDQFEAEATDSGHYDVETAELAYAAAWSEYEAARSRFMDMMLNGGTEVPLDQRLGLDDITDTERELIRADRLMHAQSAWGLFQEAEGDYMNAVDLDDVPEQRLP
ncbi:hypothetical protein ACTU6U_11200 [Microbacterium sp. A196]|uniref:hypothetical protein n=1 Tax=Microbacterium sp. A196 TaxID=3457320 RepID=UPI003FD0DF0A